ncbi:hypothetical protein [Nocardioides sp.]|uniref:hypothetical protein n=1 Tax=Nocardioides sp. TaxID=35761 RepID=UPI0025CEF270|nr:hypothetical protein [Nocardioides sp.]
MIQPQLQLLCLLLSAHVSKARRSERGASSVEWVVITALLVAIAAGAGLLIKDKITNKASSIDLGK